MVQLGQILGKGGRFGLYAREGLWSPVVHTIGQDMRNRVHKMVGVGCPSKGSEPLYVCKMSRWGPVG